MSSPVLRFARRTIMGKVSARDQELSDHCMTPLTTHIPALKCMKEIQQNCFKVGIPLTIWHREVVLGQFEFALGFTVNTVEIGQNRIVKQWSLSTLSLTPPSSWTAPSTRQQSMTWCSLSWPKMLRR